MRASGCSANRRESGHSADRKIRGTRSLFGASVSFRLLEGLGADGRTRTADQLIRQPIQPYASDPKARTATTPPASANQSLRGPNLGVVRRYASYSSRNRSPTSYFSSTSD